MPKQGISIREAARRLGVDEKTLRNWRVQGFLALFDDGSIDPDRLAEGATQAGRAQSPIHGGKRAKGRPGTAPAAPSQAAPAPDLGTDIKAAAGVSFEKVRIATEMRRARQQDLDYARDAKTLVSKARVEKALTDLGALVREVFERIPDRLAPVLAQETDPHVIRTRLVEAQGAALSEIADRAALVATGLGGDEGRL